MNLDGTVALVTGGAKRVGRAIVLELARAGCNVAVHFRDSHAEAEQLATEIGRIGRQAVTVSGDLCNASSWSAIIGQTIDGLDRLDVLVNNASVFLTGQPDSIDAFDYRQWETVYRVNLVAPAALSHHARPYLQAHGGGKIINLCDISAERPWPDHLAYCTSKAALIALTKGLARAMAPGIQVNGVAPGIAVFPDAFSAALRRKLTGQVPLGREGTPQEVARLVRFLVESGDYLTGQVIPLDGGRSLT